MNRRRIYPTGRLTPIILIFSLTLLFAALPVQAAGTVTDCTQYDDADTSDIDTLAEALVGGGTVTFSCSGTIIVPVIIISDTVTIDASSQPVGSVILNGNNANRIFNVTATGNLTITNLTIQNGNTAANGGGILNSGTVTLTDVTLSGNSAAGPGGGGIRNDGTLTITNSTLSGNSADLDGGGIYNHVVGTMTLTNVTFSGNSAIFGGGGIRNVGMLTITNSTFSGNTAGNGGGIYSDGTVTLNNSTFSGNTAGNGGGIFNTAFITNNPLSIFTNDDPIANNNTITNNGTINNNNVITNNATIQNNDTINNSCTGVITGNAVLGNPPIGTCATTTILTSDLNPSLFGDPVTFTATVTAASGIPTGDVTFLDTTTGTNLGSATLNASGQASLTTSALSVGTHAIRANYISDTTNYLDSMSNTVNQIVNALATTTALTSDLNPSNLGDPVTFTAIVTAASGIPTGSVTFVDTTSGTTLGFVTLDASGQASLTTTVLTAGSHDITATYSGSATYDISSDTLTQLVNATPTTTTLTSDLNPSNVGDPITFTATVTAASGTPTGSVTFVDTTTGTTLGFVTLDASGQGSLTTTVLTAGTHTIQANYSGAGVFLASSDTLTQLVIGPLSVTINQGAGQADPTSTSPILFDVVFSEAVTGFDGSDVDFTGSTVGGTLVAAVTGSGATYTVDVTGMTGTGTVVASIPAGAAQDSGGNLSPSSTSSDNTVTFDGGIIVTPTPTPPPVDDLPPPPGTPRCEDLNFVVDGVVRAITSDEVDYAVFCRVLYANGAPVQWLGGNLYSAGSIGHQGVLDLGVVQAVDVYSPVGLTEFEGGIEICLKGTGPLIFMAARGAPRVPVLISSHEIGDFPGFTCATLFEPGTLVLVRNNPLS